MADIDNTKNLPIRVGVSTCLLGENVRYDGGHKHDRYITDILGQYFQFVAVCPEVEVGMGVPRESVRLIGTQENPRMVGNKTGQDWTARMQGFMRKRVMALVKENLSGYILKKNSPSCGMERVRIYDDKGMAARKGIGFWGRAIMEKFPLLPVEEEGRLNDPHLRDNFIIRVFGYHRLQNLFAQKYSSGRLVEFHTIHKLLLMAHSPKHYKLLGKLVADVKKNAPSQMRDKYSALFMEGLKVKASVRKNVNVLHHIMGYLKKLLDTKEKADILQVIEDYHNELIPLIVPLTLIKHYVMKYDIEYIKGQIYLSPHPKELMLRNHV